MEAPDRGKLATPDTWEVALSAGARQARGAGSGCSRERKLGALALLRNLRNMQEAGVDEELVLGALAAMRTDRVLPFRFLAAARHAPQWEEALEQAMFSVDCRAREACRAHRAAGGRFRQHGCAASRVRRCCAPTRHTVSPSCCARSAKQVSIYSFSTSWCGFLRGAALPCATRLTEPAARWNQLGDALGKDRERVRPHHRDHR